MRLRSTNLFVLIILEAPKLSSSFEPRMTFGMQEFVFLFSFLLSRSLERAWKSRGKWEKGHLGLGIGNGNDLA